MSLPEEAQRILCDLLPETAFLTYKSTPHPAHSARGPPDGPVSGIAVERSPAALDPKFFTNPFFLSAAHTFQDHLYSGWLGSKEKGKVELFQTATRDGTMHAQWKDEGWESSSSRKLST